MFLFFLFTIFEITIYDRLIYTMLKDNPLFAEDALMKAASCLGTDSWMFFSGRGFENCENRLELGEETQKGKWIIATIMDHIFDYCPYTFFVSKTLRDDYSIFLAQFKQNPHEAVLKALVFTKMGFDAILLKNQDRVSNKRKEEEKHVIRVLEEIQNNIDEIKLQLDLPPKRDPERPTPEEIKSLITKINLIANLTLNELSSMYKDPYQTSKKILMFLNPLYMAWQVYRYGWHSDFYEEGYPDSEYMLFETDIEENTNYLITILEKTKLFNLFDTSGAITNDLLRIYRHVLKQDWKKRL